VTINTELLASVRDKIANKIAVYTDEYFEGLNL